MKTASAPALLLVACLAGCVQIESFFFAGHHADPYRWDEASPELDGDLGNSHASLVPPEDRDEGFATLADGTSIHFVLAHRPGATTTILFSHGNAEHLGRQWDRVERLWQLGFHVVTYDYPGYGRSGGVASEQGLYDAVDAVWDELPAMRDVDPDRVVLYGYSLGGGATFHLAARTLGDARRPHAIVAESVWCSMEAQIEDGAFLDLPRELLTHLHIDNCARIAELGHDLPVTLIQGTDDTIVVPHQAELLVAAASGPVELHLVPGAHHADVPNVAADYDDWVTSALSAP